MPSTINVLQASHGDCIIINTFDRNRNPFIILIDGGPPETFRLSLRNELENYTKIDLVILTHIDEDHIGGLLNLMDSYLASEIQFDKIFINGANLARVNTGTQISYTQGIELEKVIIQKYPSIKIFTDIVSDKHKSLELPDGIEIKILSPNSKILTDFYKKYPKRNIDKVDNENTQISSTVTHHAKDYNINLDALALQDDDKKYINSDLENASSIAFSLRTPDFYGLFLGDSHADVVCETFRKENNNYPILFDFIKVSHHGSKNNISTEVLNYVRSNNFIISTNGGKGRANHPDRKTIAKIVCHSKRVVGEIKFYFNYPINDIEQRVGKLLQRNDEHDFNFTFIEQNILTL